MSLSESSVAIGFNFTDNAYYAVFALLLPPVYQDIRREPPPPPPVFAVDAQESPPDYTAVIVGSVLGALSLIGLIIYGIWRWRRNRKQAVLTMYYNAVSKIKGKRNEAPPTTVPSMHLESAVPADPEVEHLERPPPPASGVLSSGAKPSVWSAVNRYRSSPSLPRPTLKHIESEEHPPPPSPSADGLSVGGTSPHTKSLVAAAVRSKMLRRKPSIHNSMHDTSTEHVAISKLDTTVDSTVSELDESLVVLSETREPDEIEVQFGAHR
jgi:hypothetical protein